VASKTLASGQGPLTHKSQNTRTKGKVLWEGGIRGQMPKFFTQSEDPTIFCKKGTQKEKEAKHVWGCVFLKKNTSEKRMGKKK